jgi:3-oxoacyl-[acyl-carrier-protein] synthase-3
MLEVGIVSVSVELPKTKRSALQLAKELNLSPGEIESQLGLKEKFVALGDDEHPSDLATRAARKALAAAGVDPDHVVLVIYTGVSRNYLPSWTVAVEVIKNLDLKSAFGFDMTAGCAATVMALNLAKDFLKDRPQKYVLIVAAERWSDTVSSKVNFPLGIVAHADGGGALLVGPQNNHHLGKLVTAVYADLNSFLMIPGGGTKEPVSEVTLKNNRHFRQKNLGLENITEHYLSAYKEIIAKCLTSNSLKLSEIDYLIINQIRWTTQKKIFSDLGIDPDRSVSKYISHGHIGSVDLMVSLGNLLAEKKPIDGQIVCASSAISTYAAISIQVTKKTWKEVKVLL